MITPEEFVSVLRKTTLSLKEQVYVLEIAQNLSFAEIEQIAKILKKDAKRKQKVLSSFESKQEKLMIDLQRELQKGLKKEQKASKSN